MIYDMVKNEFEKTELEIIQERAEVLGQAGEKLSIALQQLRAIESTIDSKMEILKSPEKEMPAGDLIKEINRDIKRFNEAREHAKLRYYYLIVTREAVGFRRHKNVEEVFPIPPRKKPLKRKEWIGIKTRE